MTYPQLERLKAEGLSHVGNIVFLKSTDNVGEMFGALKINTLSSETAQLYEWSSMAGVTFAAVAECETLSTVKTKESSVLINYLLA